ncbi:MAG TPA: methionine--tRNA ligase [Bacteroidales bacterium]|nr:MAG: methionine--tRNA ligase [Bacteroidetes bacterium GWF2_33_38]OFY76002.1 MAG: methionine--tRNA ligase [Bacteroidetes bacterium RIFOXYA12_FULL_33_9]OFY86088.1 MAG: methionine--tRNA ligase [Bacteroidetes bacterium RIFOXYA2_FULL_33_7]HBF87655.1 methionine--tRNA ligase [Bacteroidales bacterium]
MENIKRYTVTAALPYANGPVHIGHLAGVYIPADIYTRYLRLRHRDVIFVCGSDEHGVPITLKAKQRGVSPQQVVDEYHELNKKAFADFGISFDIYSRTSNKIHHETASEFFKKLHSENKFIEKTTEQYFDVEANQFLADRYITGTCPHCANESAYGDQCEKCGSSLNATDLINPKSMVSGNKPILKETTHWFLPLDKYQDFLEKWILEEHKEWKPNVYGQCKSWLDSGLQPRAVSRDLDWGVPVPIDGADGKVLYVWFDAPIGYISASKELTADWEKYWKSNDTKLVHFIGKDNIVFHCIVFPSMLKAEGSYILPDNVPSNEFLNLEGDKISTSRNWAVWLHEYLHDFVEKEDVLRYVLCANAPETKDNDFTWSDFQTRNNSELVAIFGNFVNRTMVLSWKYYEGIVQPMENLDAAEQEIFIQISKLKESIENNIENYKFREALKNLMELARLGNKYLADTEPWKLIKTNPEKVKTILNISLQLSANLAVLAEPFLPNTSKKLLQMLALEKISWDNVGGEILRAGHQLNKSELLFSQIEDAEIEKQIQRLADIKKQNEMTQSTAKPLKENVSFDDFTKLDIRVGTILEAEKVAKTKKLLKLLIDTGIDKRTVVSGIAEYYEPENIIGQQVCLIANLAPREIKGIMSQGMILMAENANGELIFASPVKNVKEGSEVK